MVREHCSRKAIETAEGRAWTYAELWTQALAMRQGFFQKGVGKGDIVALVLPRSPEFVAGLVACWLCEAVALPVDVRLPSRRITDMLEEAKPRLIFQGGIPQSEGKPQEILPEDDLGSAAYLIYTSGSSGRPKGVLVSHAGLVPVLAAQIEMFQITSESRCWWMHSTGFDASISDIGTVLLGGATLCFTEREADFAPSLGSMGITHVDLPPAMLPHLKAKPPALRVIVIGGEVCAASVVREWASKVRLVNVYGPTEATICTSMTVCGTDWQRAWIGEPVPGVEYRVEEDELLIRGEAVALGYPWQPELWRERFSDGWYRTGDRVARHEDGRLEFIGRTDRQMKRHGRLICPEEIERFLLEVPGVRRATVFPWQCGRRMLLAACVEGGADAAGLRRALQQHLPGWMIPGMWCFIESLPVLANGKPDVDSMLHLLKRDIAGRGEMSRASFSPDETRVAELFESVLQLPRVGLNEDFCHDLGGDSLAVVELMAEAAVRGIHLPADAVARGRTVAGVARLIHAHEWLAREELEPDAAAALPVFSSWFQRPESVLVIGASGFLGRAVTEELRRRGLRVIGMSRSSEMKGDVRQPRFGLDEERWRSLANEVDTVFHLAAEVRLFAPYHDLRESQVEGALNVLRFCAEGRGKALHFASSLSVFVDADPLESLCMEDDPRRGVERLHGGYAQSKWVAEQLVLRASEAGLPCWVHRLGLLSMNTLTGDAPVNDWLTLALPGLAVADPALEMDLTPVDHAARVMVALACAAAPGIYHIANPCPVPRARIGAFLQSGRLSASASLASMRAGGREFHRSLDLAKATGVRFDMSRARQALAGSGIEFPEITDDYLRTCLLHALNQTQDPP